MFATDAWIRRGVGGDPHPWRPLDLPRDQMPDTAGISRDRSALPSLDAVLELHHDRPAGVRLLMGGLTDEALTGITEPVEGPGWPPSESIPVRECLLVVLDGAWCHRQYAERDLAALTQE